jgi:hypothetical protein
VTSAELTRLSALSARICRRYRVDGDDVLSAVLVRLVASGESLESLPESVVVRSIKSAAIDMIRRESTCFRSGGQLTDYDSGTAPDVLSDLIDDEEMAAARLVLAAVPVGDGAAARQARSRYLRANKLSK